MKGKLKCQDKNTVGVIRSMYYRGICSHKLFKKYCSDYSMLIPIAEPESSRNCITSTGLCC